MRTLEFEELPLRPADDRMNARPEVLELADDETEKVGDAGR